MIFCLSLTPGRAATSALRGEWNVILIVNDALRADHMGTYSYARNTTPHIDRFFKSGAIFSNAFAQATWTLPSLASIMTSLYPSVHGAIYFPNDAKWVEDGYTPPAGKILDNSRLTLAEVLQDRGYLTAGVASGGFTNSAFGFSQGFSQYVDGYKSMQGINRTILPWLEKNHAQKFFLYIHSIDAHDPYKTSPRFDQLWDPDYVGDIDGRREIVTAVNNGKRTLSKDDLHHLIALYDGGISYLDEQLGQLFDKLDELDVADKTLIVLTADHGEQFMEHGNLSHGWLAPYDEVLRVPLLFRVPAQATGRQIAQVVESIDIMPTILDFLAITPPQPVQGQSLLPLVYGAASQAGTAFAESAHSDDKRDAVRVLRTRRWKYIRRMNSGPDELYDLKKDPLERVNRIAEEPDLIKSLTLQFTQWEQENLRVKKSLPPLTGKPSSLEEETVEQLKFLGYLP